MLARLPQGQTLDSRWVGESERYLQRSGKPRPRREERRKGMGTRGIKSKVEKVKIGGGYNKEQG